MFYSIFEIHRKMLHAEQWNWIFFFYSGKGPIHFIHICHIFKLKNNRHLQKYFGKNLWKSTGVLKPRAIFLPTFIWITHLLPQFLFSSNEIIASRERLFSFLPLFHTCCKTINKSKTFFVLKTSEMEQLRICVLFIKDGAKNIVPWLPIAFARKRERLDYYYKQPSEGNQQKLTGNNFSLK